MVAGFLFAPFAVIFALEPTRIVLDGRFDDWSEVPVVLADPADAPESAVDLGEIKVSHDDRFVHLLVEVRRTVNLQKMSGTLRVHLDADGNEMTDVVVEFSPPDDGPGRSGRGARLVQPGSREPRSAYEIGLAFAPSYASDTFELRMERDRSFLDGERFTARLEFVDRNGETLDRTDTFAHALGPIDIPPRRQPRDPLTRGPRTTLRVVSWNVEFGSLFARPEPFGRVLRALEPDVVFFQELMRDTTPEKLAAYLDRWLPGRGGRRWKVIVGAGGGDLRCAVAARGELAVAPGLEVIAYPDRPDRMILLATAVVGAPQRVLVASVHLRCCGSTGSFEDRTRQVEADAIRRAVRSAMADHDYDGVVIGGDLNLVGSRRPLELLAEGVDADGSNLAVAEAFQLDGRTNATWSDLEQPFMPGRLDFLLYSDATLDASRSFVLETRDLEPRWLKRHLLLIDDTASAADHLPIVLDLRRGVGAR
jgi:endonuclease/exonuclease/phosphatase family metal-dependent hydrolase